MKGREVVIVDAARTPIGRGHHEKGIYREVHPTDLLAKPLVGVVNRSGVDAHLVEHVISGCANQMGEQAFNVARNAWLAGGLPTGAGATTVDTRCGSGQQAVGFAASLIAAGVHDFVVGAGVEHMGHVSFTAVQEIDASHGPGYSPSRVERFELVSQGVAADGIADRWEVSRSELDEIALHSHERAARATDEGRFDREIVPVAVNGDLHTADQGIRRQTTPDSLAELKPAFLDGGRITAGNSSQISDGAAAVLLASRDRAEELGLPIRARIVDQTTVGVDPVTMLTGPIPATRLLLERNSLSITDLDLIEINEAFASVIAAWQRELDADLERVNVNGGAIAIGHPLGATGARLITTLLHELERSDGELGLVTMCCGGGIGTGTLIQRL